MGGESGGREPTDPARLVTELLEEREQYSEGWLREQLSGILTERREELESLLDEAAEPGNDSILIDWQSGTGQPSGSESADWGSFQGWHGASKPSRDDDDDGGFRRWFTWEYRGYQETFELEIPGHLFRYYTNRHRTRDFGVYIADPFDEPFVTTIANQIRAFGDDIGLGRREQVTAAVRFVQSLEYTPDDVTTGQSEYPKYPVETLVHDGGDCEDTSILLGAILRELGCEVAPIVMPSRHHMVLGVAPDFDAEGAHYEHEGTEYYVLEATGHGWDIGELPPAYGNAGGVVHPVDDRPILVHEWEAVPGQNGGVEISIDVANFGDADAEGLRTFVKFEDESGDVHATRQLCTGETLVPSNTAQFESTVSLPDDRALRGRCLLLIGNDWHDVSRSELKGP